jgi:hypothetical protein
MSSSSPVFDIPNLSFEIKSAYEREWNRKESFESKAITISGMVATLLFGFATLFLLIATWKYLLHLTF